MVSFSTIVVPAATSAVATPTSTSESVQPSTPRLDGKAFNQGLQAQGGVSSGASSADSDSEAVKQLKELIKDLQKRLAEEQRQLSQIMSQRMSEQAKAAAIAGKQTSISSLSAALMTATSQLLEALTASGGGSAGSMVSTEA